MAFRRTIPLSNIRCLAIRTASDGHQRAPRACRALVIAALVLPMLGCRTQPYVNSHIESVNAEYRQLEDYVYALEEENSRLHQELDNLKTAQTSGTASGGAAPPGRGGIFRRPPAGATPRRQSPATEETPEFKAPVIEVPDAPPPPRSPGSRSTLQRPPLDATESTAPGDTPPRLEPSRRQLDIQTPTPAEESLPAPPMPRGIPGPSAPEIIPAKPIDKKVTHLFLNPLHTGGADFDGQPGDDGVRILVEPRNASGQCVPEAGALSVVLLDPERQGDAARIARWDFDLSATRQMLASASPDQGLKLELPWPAAAPTVNHLKLFVRYETPDGRRLQTDREVFVTPASQVISRWTPRSADRPRPADSLADANDSESTATPVSVASARSMPADEHPARPIWSPNR
jgi:hypothetical protein